MELIFILILAQECCANKMSLRIHGGRDAKPEEYPYVVRIERQTSYNYTNNTVIVRHQSICTASALSPVWLLTAAHCLQIKNSIIYNRLSYTVNKMVIRYGHVENSPWRKDSFSEVLYTIMHPLYMTKVNRWVKASRNDIGLLKTSPINIRCYMKISSVDYKTMYGHEVIIGGYGLMTKTDSEGYAEINSTLHFMKPLQLLKVLVSKCSFRFTIVPGLCLASRCIDVTNACPGDSGGPVIHPSGLIGVLVLSESTCRSGLRRVNTAAYINPVSPYIEWIYSYVHT